MKALQITAPETVEVVELPEPTIGDNQILVKMRACSLCKQTDLHYFAGQAEGGTPKAPFPPGDPGHEGAGDVIAVGKGVKNFKVGDRVTTCQHQTYKELNAVDIDKAIKISEKVSYEEAAPLELGRCISYTTRLAAPIERKTVAIMGLGPAGLMAVQMAKARGATFVIGVDIVESKLALALELGTDQIVNTADSEDYQKFLSRNDISVVIECTGNPEIMKDAFQAARDQVVFFAHTDKPLTVNQFIWFSKGLTIKNVNLGNYRVSGTDLDDFQAAGEMLEQGILNTKKLITYRCAWTEYEKAIEAVKAKDALKVILSFV